MEEESQRVQRRIGVIPEEAASQILKDTKLRVSYLGVGHWGYSVSVIKSALQKGCRRNDEDITAWSIREAYLYYHLGLNYIENVKPAAKSLNTNMVNRIKIIAVEDTSPRSMVASNECVRTLEKYEKGNFRQPSYLMDAAMRLVHASSSRVCSHMRALCCKEEDSDKLGGIYYANFNELETQCVSAVNFSPIERIKHVFREIESVKLGKKSVQLLNLRSVAAYHVLRYYGDKVKDTNKKHSGPFKRKEFEQFWGLCFKFVTQHVKTDPELRCYFNELTYAINWRRDFFCSKGFFREESLFLTSIVELIIAMCIGDRKQFAKIQKRDLKRFNKGEEGRKEEAATFDWIEGHVKRMPQMPVWVLDKHTNKNTHGVSFALESSMVSGGDKRWSPGVWLHSYTKMRLDSPPPPEVGQFLDQAFNTLKREAASHCVTRNICTTTGFIKASSFTANINSEPMEIKEEIKKRKIEIKDDNTTATVTVSATTSSSITSTPPPTKKQKTTPSGSNKVDSIQLNNLPTLNMEDLDRVLEVHNQNSKKGVAATVLMKDGNKVVFKEMRKSFGWGSHQNFVQVLKDEDVCKLDYLLPCPDSGPYRGLYRCYFKIVKDEISSTAARIEKVKWGENAMCYFISGCVTRQEGIGKIITDVRLSHVGPNKQYVYDNYRQLIHILIFRLLTGVSDTNTSNILVGDGGNLFSVDENYVGAKDPRTALENRKIKELQLLLKTSFKVNKVTKEDIDSCLPSWLFDTSKSDKIMNGVCNIGKNMGIGPTTLDIVKNNCTCILGVVNDLLYDNK
ncbi:hypothetical protein [White spot syndrome virus]|uniref:Wsv244 n=1 Tax=White spot syndrome virus TaxID=342409 RepID=A0A2U8T4P5_9VIRU|nr:hypothetical protein [White spot syndrome virus]